MADDDRAGELARFHVERANTLRTNRGIFDEHCEEVAAIAMPMHRNTFTGWSWITPYVKKTTLQFDATATLAVQRFASVIESLLTPQNSIWHRITPYEPALRKSRVVMGYLEQVNDIIRRRRNRPTANFVGQVQMSYLSLGLYGNAALFVDELAEGDAPRYKYLHIGNTYFVDNHQGQVDSFYRFFKLSARQAVEQFGDALPEGIKTRAQQPNSGGDPNENYEFLHCVVPRSDYEPGRLDLKGKKWASFYFAVESKKLLSEGGYRVFPAAISRYVQAPQEVYGRGPAMLVLPQIKLLNEEKKAIIRQAHRALDPPLMAADDGVIGTFSLRNGAVNYGAMTSEGKPLVAALPVGNLAVGEKILEQDAGTINDAFLITLFQILVKQPQMSATEVLERAREKGMLLAPTGGRQQAEFLGPLITREIDLAEAQGALPPMPPQLREAGGGYVLEYDNPMSRMQRAEYASGFMRALQTASEYAQLTQDTRPLDWFNFDEAMPDIMDISGSPIRWTNTPDQVAQQRKNKAEQEQQAMMLKNAAGLGSGLNAVVNAGKAAGKSA